MNYKKILAIPASIMMLSTIVLTPISAISPSISASERVSQSVDELNAGNPESAIPDGQSWIPDLSTPIDSSKELPDDDDTNADFQKPEMYWSTTTITGVRSGQSTTLKFFNDQGKLDWTDEQYYIDHHTSNMATAINGGSWTDKYSDYLIGHNPGAGGNLFATGISYKSSGKSDGTGYTCNIVGKKFKIASHTYKITSVSLMGKKTAKMSSTSSTAGTFKKGYDIGTSIIAKINGTKQSKDIVYIQTCKVNSDSNWFIRAERQ